ncbi:class I SAM-dependent methyltransferase [Micromonospora sp. WMMD980]|uniref:class I SAM-dependent methyltransferase n=1 Tax=Micromonospora sp. WMMD980 TaxID=3016088 RepID=UPI0024160972|nr:class I SAM-dependent methyltransferase [Micromonospora sp. WMMD980]MDG4804526.1 class I SAM-dependent methyltransferase [Micromonospora sp. WMMD980]
MGTKDLRAPKRKVMPEMEGAAARWYARNRGSAAQLVEYRRQAVRLAEGLPDGAAVLEVAPGPGYLAIELARLGAYRITGLDVSRTFVALAGEAARRAGVVVDFRQGDVHDLPFRRAPSTWWSARRRSRTSSARCGRWTRCTGCCGRAAGR